RLPEKAFDTRSTSGCRFDIDGHPTLWSSMSLSTRGMSSGRGCASRAVRVASAPSSQRMSSSSRSKMSLRERRWSSSFCCRCRAHSDTSSQRDWMIVTQCRITVTASG
ncbi:unnamed protein product, partial [Ixodes persulcatus]